MKVRCVCVHVQVIDLLYATAKKKPEWQYLTVQTINKLKL
jgi:hypothetical protein